MRFVIVVRVFFYSSLDSLHFSSLCEGCVPVGSLGPWFPAVPWRTAPIVGLHPAAPPLPLKQSIPPRRLFPSCCTVWRKQSRVGDAVLAYSWLLSPPVLPGGSRSAKPVATLSLCAPNCVVSIRGQTQRASQRAFISRASLYTNRLH